MYLRATQRRNKDGSVVRYLALAENVRDAEKGYVGARVVHSFGRADELDRAALERLVRSMQRLDPVHVRHALASQTVELPMRPPCVLLSDARHLNEPAT